MLLLRCAGISFVLTLGAGHAAPILILLIRQGNSELYSLPPDLWWSVPSPVPLAWPRLPQTSM